MAGTRDMDGKLIELAVVLVAHSNNPSILNPDFLIHNGIVSDGAEVEQPVISTPAFSQARFKSGVVITADPDRVIFSTAGLSDEKTEAPRMAKRYLQRVPHTPYRAIGVNPKLIASSADHEPGVADALRDRGAWMSFKDVMPRVALKFVYSYGDRTINLDVADVIHEENGKTLHERMFLANIHRELIESNTKSRNERIKSILDAWEDDVNDVRCLIGKFCQEK